MAALLGAAGRRRAGRRRRTAGDAARRRSGRAAVSAGLDAARVLALGRSAPGGLSWLARGSPDRRVGRSATRGSLFGVLLLWLWEVVCRRLRRAARAAAGALAIAGAIAAHLPTLAADFVQTFAPRGAARLADRLRRRASSSAIAARPLRLPAPRAAAARQPRRGPADRRHRADHGDVVRLRLAVEGRRGRGDDLLPDAGEHGGRAWPAPARWSAT